MTKRAKQVLDFICCHVSKNGVAPSFREIGDELNIKSSAVTEHIERLERDGRIVRRKGKHRSIEVVDYDSLASPATTKLKAMLEALQAKWKALDKRTAPLKISADNCKVEAVRLAERVEYFGRLVERLLPGYSEFIAEWKLRAFHCRRKKMRGPKPPIVIGRDYKAYFKQDETLAEQPVVDVFKRLKQAGIIETWTYGRDYDTGKKHAVPVIVVRSNKAGIGIGPGTSRSAHYKSFGAGSVPLVQDYKWPMDEHGEIMRLEVENDKLRKQVAALRQRNNRLATEIIGKIQTIIQEPAKQV